MSLPRNLDEIRAKDQKLFECLSDIISQHAVTSQQGNFNATGHPEPPPSIAGLRVTAANGHFSAAIDDPNPIYRGVQYFVEHSGSPNFTDPHVIHLGATRNHTVFLGNVTRYWRAYSSYSSSAPGAPAYHGGAGTPQAVTGGGSIGGPSFLASQGSGTGTPGEGLSGAGRVPFRSSDGVPPIRKL